MDSALKSIYKKKLQMINNEVLLKTFLFQFKKFRHPFLETVNIAYIWKLKSNSKDIHQSGSTLQIIWNFANAMEYPVKMGKWKKSKELNSTRYKEKLIIIWPTLLLLNKSIRGVFLMIFKYST